MLPWYRVFCNLAPLSPESAGYEHRMPNIISGLRQDLHQYCANRTNDARLVRDNVGLEWLTVGNRRVSRSDLHHRGLQCFEAVLGNVGGDHGSDGRVAGRLIYQHNAPRLVDGFQDRLEIERRNNAHVARLPRDRLDRMVIVIVMTGNPSVESSVEFDAWIALERGPGSGPTARS